MRIKRFNQFVNEAITNYRNIDLNIIKSYLSKAYDIYERDFNRKYPNDIIDHPKVFNNDKDNNLYKKDVLNLIKTIFNLDHYYNIYVNIIEISIIISNRSLKLEDTSYEPITPKITAIPSTVVVNMLKLQDDLIKDIENIFHLKIFTIEKNFKNKTETYDDIDSLITNLYINSNIKSDEFNILSQINFKEIVKTIEHLENPVYITKSTFKEIKDSTEEEIFNKFPWFKKAVFNNAVVEIFENKLHWIDGHWTSGIWEDGTWSNGIWYDGEWYGGDWYDGKFLKGEWYGGEFNDGEFNGTWHDGIFNGKFENGEWYDGTFNNGTFNKSKWHYGTFNGGYFKDSLWMDGIWELGEFVNSIWMYGLWIDGDFYSHEWHDGVYVNNRKKTIYLKQAWREGIVVNDPNDREEFQAALDEKEIKYKI